MYTGSLLKPEFFQRQGKWFICKLCDVGSKEKEKMKLAAAKLHEKSKEHVYQIEKNQWGIQDAWAMPASGGMSGWETKINSDWTTKTDRLTLIVEYWYKGVQAAHRGEELKFESFLETLED